MERGRNGRSGGIRKETQKSGERAHRSRTCCNLTFAVLSLSTATIRSIQVNCQIDELCVNSLRSMSRYKKEKAVYKISKRMKVSTAPQQRPAVDEQQQAEENLNEQ